MTAEVIMGRSNQHYERAFESFLIRSRVPHLMVDDARRAVLPPNARLGCVDADGRPVKVKSFDAVVYGDADRGRPSLLVEVKGRRVDLRRGGVGRRESWTTAEDVRSLQVWERLFGGPFEAVLLFWYWLEGPVANAIERSVFRFEGRAYAHKAVRVSDYARLMRVRSPKWGTVNLASEDLEAVGMPLLDVLGGKAGSAGGVGVGLGVGSGVGVGSGDGLIGDGSARDGESGASSGAVAAGAVARPSGLA